MSISQQALVNRGPRPVEKREIAFFVRAKTGPGSRDWSPVGVCFARKNNEPGYTIKLNTLPIGEWSGALVLVPPYVQEDVVEEEPPHEPEPTSRRRRRDEPDPTI